MDLLEASHLDKNVDVAVTVKASFMPPSSELRAPDIFSRFFVGVFKFQMLSERHLKFEIRENRRKFQI